MKPLLSKNSKATIAGYLTAVYNAIMVIDIDNLNFNLPSTYFKLFGAIIMPIVAGHITETKI